jgi:hypothetical protein
MDLQNALNVQEKNLMEAVKAHGNAEKEQKADAMQNVNRINVVVTEAKKMLKKFIAKNKTLEDLRDDPSTTTALLTYYRSIKATKGLAVSLEISRQQEIDKQMVKIPFWYPVIP